MLLILMQMFWEAVWTNGSGTRPETRKLWVPILPEAWKQAGWLWASAQLRWHWGRMQVLRNGWRITNSLLQLNQKDGWGFSIPAFLMILPHPIRSLEISDPHSGGLYTVMERGLSNHKGDGTGTLQLLWAPPSCVTCQERCSTPCDIFISITR